MRWTRVGSQLRNSLGLRVVFADDVMGGQAVSHTAGEAFDPSQGLQ